MLPPAGSREKQRRGRGEGVASGGRGVSGLTSGGGGGGERRDRAKLRSQTRVGAPVEDAGLKSA